MTSINENKSQHNITAGKVLITAGISCIPLVSAPGDLLYKTIKNHRVDKTPLNDSFKKAVKDSGKQVQEVFSSLKNKSAFKVGAIAFGIGTLIDVLFTYWCVDKISDSINNKKRK